ncbi:hypothetical protein [Hyalangium gracile]|uniref:hypothetical protein n=1 Tax=Hyalangium gracile TaxID=394092 RepID=UPI001CCE8EEB|nr:hypothetical protein [Hyalangium gracile]
MNPRVVRWCLSLGLLMALTGCASARHREALYEHAHQHMYKQPIEQVWPEVVRLVAAQGYGHRKGDQEFVLITEWRNDTMASRVVSSASRLYVEGYRLQGGFSTVRIFRQTIFTGNKGPMTAHDNSFTDSLTVAAEGDILAGAEDPIKMNQFLNTSADHTPLTRSPAQLTRSFSRDGELEWKLLQMVDAQAASTIEARVTEEEQK